MGVAKDIARKIPLLSSLYVALRDRYYSGKLAARSREDIFTDIYRRNGFRGKQSVSGPGSDPQQTRHVAGELPRLFREHGIRTVLDVPCGDFHWMKDVDLHEVDYLGTDIVSDLIVKNQANYARDGIRFRQLNLITDELPTVDLVLCRDCFVHLSFADIALALENIRNSKSGYLLTTTFIDRGENRDIATGLWRTLNLERLPFRFPAPVELIVEGCTEGDGAFRDKALGLWRISDLRPVETHR